MARPFERGRTPGVVFGEFLQSLADSPSHGFFIMTFLAATAWFAPILIVPCVFAGSLFLLRDPSPARGPLGNDFAVNDPGENFVIGSLSHDGSVVMASDEAMLRQSVVLGTTGSGKSENLLGFAMSSLARKSGLVYCEPLGHDALHRQVQALAAMHGREDDVLLLDMRNPSGQSNTFRPFDGMAKDDVVGLLQAVLDLPEQGDESDVRLLHLLSATVENAWDASGGRLATSDLGARDLTHAWHDLFSNADRSPATSCYLAQLPGYNEQRGVDQPPSAVGAYGKDAARLAPLLDALACIGSPGTGPADIDLRDVIANRRILVVRLPDSDRKREMTGCAGRIFLAKLVDAMRAIESGDMPSDGHEVPMLCILDRYESYALNGFSETVAACPEACVAPIYSSQDGMTLKQAGRESRAVLANAGLKVFMRTEEVEVTAFLSAHADGADPDKADRFDPLDIKSMGAGEMLVMYEERRLFMKSRYFNAAPGVSTRRGNAGWGTHLLPMPARATEATR